MRAILLILIVAVVALIAAVQTGLIDIRQTRPRGRADGRDGKAARSPPRPGRRPAFDVETGSIGVGTRDAKVAGAQGRSAARARRASPCRASKSAARPRSSQRRHRAS